MLCQFSIQFGCFQKGNASLLLFFNLVRNVEKKNHYMHAFVD
jgi:hypothetical protein